MGELKAMTMKKIFPVFLAAAIILGGCSASPAPSSSTVAPAPSVTEVKDGINAQSPEQLKGGKLRLAVTELPKTWNRCHKEAPQGKYHNPLAPLQPSFFKFNNNGKAEPNESFIKSIKTIDNRIKISLNPDVAWQNGSPISTEDWLLTWKALNGSDKNYQVAASCDWSNLKDFQVDETKDEISFSVNNEENWQALLTNGPLPKSGISTAELFNSGWTTPKPEFFAGPFSVNHIDPELITEVANPNYPKTAVLSQITFRLVAFETWPLAFQKNEIDAIYLGMKIPKQAVSLTQLRSNGTTSLMVLELSPDLSLPIRQAVSAAIDAAALTPANANSARNLIFLPQQEGYKNSASRTGLVPNLGTAQDILTSLGYQYTSVPENKEEKYWQLANKPLTIVLPKLTNDTDPRQKDLTAQIMKQLKDFGIKPVFTNDSNHPKADLTFKVITLTQNPGQNALSYDAQVLNSLSSFTAAENFSARNDLLNQIADKAWLEAKVIPLYQLPEFALTKENLANYGAFGLAEPDWAIVGWLK